MNHETLIFNFSNLHFSDYELSFILCALFPDSSKGNQIPSSTHSLNEWIPWSWEAIQGGYKKLLFFFDCFIIESNTSFWCLQGWNMRDEMIFNRNCNYSLGSILRLISLWLLEIPYWNTNPSQFLQGSWSSYTYSNLYSFLQNSLVKEPNISLGVFREDICGIRWYNQT